MWWSKEGRERHGEEQTRESGRDRVEGRGEKCARSGVMCERGRASREGRRAWGRSKGTVLLLGNRVCVHDSDLVSVVVQ